MTRAQQREFHKNLITQEFEDYLWQMFSRPAVNSDSTPYAFYIAFWRYVVFSRMCRQAYLDHDPRFNFFVAQVKVLKRQLKKRADALTAVLA